MQKQVLSSVGGANLKETICFYFSKKYIFEKNSDHIISCDGKSRKYRT
jgi:hypothetical protein